MPSIRENTSENQTLSVKISNPRSSSASVVQWLGFLPIDQKVMGLNPSLSKAKGVFF